MEVPQTDTPREISNQETPEDERDVSFDEGMRGIDQAPDAPQAEAGEGEKEDVLEILESKAEVKEWTIGKDDYERKYVQRPLSFLAKMQWFSLVGEVLDKAMSGDDRLSVNSLLSAPTNPDGTLTMADFRDADTFVQAIGKLLTYAPDFLVKSYCIWLAVPDYERELAKQIMSLPPEEGGLTDSDGIEIIERFIDQNYEALDTFFRQEVSRIQRRIQAQQKAAADRA